MPARAAAAFPLWRKYHLTSTDSPIVWCAMRTCLLLFLHQELNITLLVIFSPLPFYQLSGFIPPCHRCTWSISTTYSPLFPQFSNAVDVFNTQLRPLSDLPQGCVAVGKLLHLSHRLPSSKFQKYRHQLFQTTCNAVSMERSVLHSRARPSCVALCVKNELWLARNWLWSGYLPFVAFCHWIHAILIVQTVLPSTSPPSLVTTM